MRDESNKVPTRLNLSIGDVDMVIAKGRMATRLTPEFNGFLASLSGSTVEGRINAGIAAGGQRVEPLGN